MVAGVGWWTGIRETSVNEDVAVASQSATGAERDAALAGDSGNFDTGPANKGGGDNGSGGAGVVAVDSDQQKRSNNSGGQ